VILSVNSSDKEAKELCLGTVKYFQCFNTILKSGISVIINSDLISIKKEMDIFILNGKPQLI
jgi:hypothetical protein